MTDRINSFLVVLEQDLREEDATALMMAMLKLRGVYSVSQNVSDIGKTVAKQQAAAELRLKLLKLLDEP